MLLSSGALSLSDASLLTSTTLSVILPLSTTLLADVVQKCQFLTIQTTNKPNDYIPCT